MSSIGAEELDSTGLAAPRRLSAIPEVSDPTLMASELSGLDPEQRLDRLGDLEVWCAKAPQVHAILREIGRLREITFRAEGEGSGSALDLDEFDLRYRHLFVWNSARFEVVAAYRLGLTDEILPAFGRRGLYCTTLFRIPDRFWFAINPAIELGRSFVRMEYQKSFGALHLLWKGIGRFIALNPRYRYLYGPVSISSRYHRISQRLLLDFLSSRALLHPWAARVRGRTPPRLPELDGGLLSACASSSDPLAAVDESVTQAESGLRGMPVLMRQYLRLGARVLGFNVDRAFGDVLDALMLVDLLQADRAVTLRYLGTAGWERLIEMRSSSISSPW